MESVNKNINNSEQQKKGYHSSPVANSYKNVTEHKDSDYFNAQLNKYYNYLLTNIATNKMICKVLDIPIENGTKYKRILEKRNNPNNAPFNNQLKLF